MFVFFSQILAYWRTPQETGKMTTIQEKYERPLMSCMTQTLPELKEAEKTCKVPKTDVANIKALIEHDNHHNRRKIESLIGRGRL